MVSHTEIENLFITNIKNLTSRGDQRTGLCPFHEDHNSSFSVNISKGLWICFTCGLSGDSFEFAKRVRIDPTPYSKNGHTGSKMNYSTQWTESRENGHNAVAQPIELDDVNKKLAFDCHKYLIENYSELDPPSSWSIEVVEKLFVGYCAKRKRFTFPHLNEAGKIINLKFHKSVSGETPYSIEGYGKCRLYPLNLFKNHNSDEILIFCEGEKDCVSLISQGYNAVTSSTGAGSIPKDLSPLLKFKHIKILLDNDEAGKNGSIKLFNRLIQQFPIMKVEVVSWPDRFPNKFDITDFFTNKDLVNFEDILSDVRDFQSPVDDHKTNSRTSLQIIDKRMDFWGIIMDSREKPIEMIEGILPVESIMGIVSNPGVGKTILAMNLAIHLSAGKPWFGHDIVKPRRVLYLLAEGGFWSLKSRLRMMSEYEILPPKESFFPIPVRPYDLLNDDDLLLFSSLINECDPDVIVLDTFIKCHTADENDNGAMQRVLDIVRSTITGNGRSAIICHHLSKSGQSRGATSIEGELDTLIKLESVIKQNHSIKVKFDKIRHGENIRSMNLLLNPETLIFESTDEPVSDRYKIFMDYFEDGKGHKKKDIVKQLQIDIVKGESTCYDLFKTFEEYIYEENGVWYKK